LILLSVTATATAPKTKTNECGPVTPGKPGTPVTGGPLPPARPVVPTLVFERPSVSCIETSLDNVIRVKLSGAPIANMNVVFPFAVLRFDKCVVTFTKQNWNTWQTIRFSVPPAFAEVKPITYSIPFTLRDSDNQKIATTGYSIVRNPLIGQVGTSTGDPHYYQFNKHYFANQISGTVYLVNHKQFSVQAIQQPCSPSGKDNVSCNQAVAIRYGCSAIVVDARDHKVRVGRLTSNTDGIVYTSTSANSHTIQFPDGSFVSVSVSAFDQRFGVHITISVGLAPHWTNFGGILNDPTLPKGQLRLPDRKVTTDAALFTRSWIVPSSDNLFNGKVRVVTPLFRPNFCIRPATLFTDALPKHVVRYTVGNPQKRQIDDATKGEPNFDDLAKRLPTEFLERAKSVCDQTISGSTACAGTTNTTVIIDECYKDAIMSNSLGFTSDHLQNFHQICLEVTKSLEAMGDDESSLKALTIQQQAGLGEFPCPKNCNNRGKCLDLGCECKDGFTGSSCEISI
jgi:hypothetical protein